MHSVICYFITARSIIDDTDEFETPPSKYLVLVKLPISVDLNVESMLTIKSVLSFLMCGS